MLHRNIHYSLDGATIVKSISVGFPQGDVASAKFWLLAFDDAVRIINTKRVKGTAFADDCSGLYSGRLLGHMLRNMQLVLDDLVAWGRTCGLEFNAEKTIVVLFSRRRVVPHFRLEMDGVEIPFSNSVRYLGVTGQSARIEAAFGGKD